VIFILFTAVGISTALFLRNQRARISAQGLLREAVLDQGPLGEIFEQQAGQGYYEDAFVTARVFASSLPDRDYELSGLTEQLVVIRAENGDIQGAKEMIGQFGGSALGNSGPKATREIAGVQVEKGDLQGALQTVASPADRDEIMEEFGRREIDNGDFAGALKTAERVSENSAYQLFYDLGDALRQSGGERRLKELAASMTDRKRAAELLEAARFTLHPSIELRTMVATPCDIAWGKANAGRFAEAYRLLEQGKCQYSGIAVKQFATDPAEAERRLRQSTDKEDISRGMAKMSEAATKAGNVADALRLLGSARQVSGDPDFCLDCVREIAWAWTLKGQPRIVLRWARSLPVAHQERGFALLGVAQALGHARPK
jgi:hypothetical protein